jgi:hypothetical protein
MSTDTDTLMYWIRSYHGCNECDEKIYLFWRAREWAAHVIATGL